MINFYVTCPGCGKLMNTRVVETAAGRGRCPFCKTVFPDKMEVETWWETC